MTLTQARLLKTPIKPRVLDPIIKTLCVNNIKKIQHQVRLGYPGKGEDGSCETAILTVTADHLALKSEHRPRLEMFNTEIVEFKIDGLLPFLWQAIVVEHVAFEKIGTLVFHPTGMSCRNLLRKIKKVGFQPEATPAVAWKQGQLFPIDLEKDNDTQQCV
ncbi:hypothetical protein P3T73_13050 [Kiritimatiellota bacterium B12222]|nr:hypothetical protein P3T73_13050 [Kiritimatiellota bacterium B12222]